MRSDPRRWEDRSSSYRQDEEAAAEVEAEAEVGREVDRMAIASPPAKSWARSEERGQRREGIRTWHELF